MAEVYPFEPVVFPGLAWYFTECSLCGEQGLELHLIGISAHVCEQCWSVEDDVEWPAPEDKDVPSGHDGCWLTGDALGPGVLLLAGGGFAICEEDTGDDSSGDISEGGWGGL